ncbi:MAG: hypothetical protein ACREMY_18515 [bacterium]
MPNWELLKKITLACAEARNANASSISVAIGDGEALVRTIEELNNSCAQQAQEYRGLLNVNADANRRETDLKKQVAELEAEGRRKDEYIATLEAEVAELKPEPAVDAGADAGGGGDGADAGGGGDGADAGGGGDGVS